MTVLGRHYLDQRRLSVRRCSLCKVQHPEVWALSGHSLQIERMTGLAQNLNLSRRSKGRGLRNTILTQLTLASNVGVEIYWGIHFHSCTNLELNRDANFVGAYFTIIS